MAGAGQGHDGRRRPVGAELSAGGTSFRVWAPRPSRVSVVLADGRETLLARDPDGYHAGFVAGIGAGARYSFRLDADERLYPDPASRAQPDGPHGPSRVEDPAAYAWSDAAWTGIGIAGRIVYELHVGTFTPEGTWRAAATKLPFLASVGIDTIEMMPVADFPGAFGWGYDGVNLYAPTRLYGEPDDLRSFIDRAHALGIAVILDVVYNHLGPDGNFLSCFSPAYFTDRYSTEWGEAINFDGPDSAPVREFFVQNAAYWIDEFHFDGLRLDATQSIFDASPRHVIAELGAAARAAAADRSIILIGENEPQDANLVRPESAGGCGLDALWNDDLHHSAMVALTGRAEAYYEDHHGAPQEFVSAAKYGYLFQGQLYSHQGKGRGVPGLDLPPASFVTFMQNHDQVANSASGLRFDRMSHPGLARAMTALLLLMPGTPMLFQGQEFGASTPFFYFCDHAAPLSDMVREGRVEFLRQFPSIRDDASVRERLASPADRKTFERSKLDWGDVERHASTVALHRDLIALRRDATFSRQVRGCVDGAVLAPEIVLLRYFGTNGDDRLILTNLGRDFHRASFAEPLCAPPFRRRWELAFSTENAAYGGSGTACPADDDGWHLPAASTLVMKSSS